MLNPSPLIINNMASGVSGPAIGPARTAPKGITSIEEAENILKLVNVGKEVLDVASLNMKSPELISVAQQIVSSRKNGSNIEFANGRINIPRDLFEKIVTKSTCEADNPNNARLTKMPSNFEAKTAPAVPLEETPDLKKEKKSSKNTKPEKAAVITLDSDTENIRQLSPDQAYFILIDIESPSGGKYVLEIKESFEDTHEERRELEKCLENFWNDYGNNISINSTRNNFVIKPKLLLGATVNSEVSKKLVVIYISQSAAEKIKNSRIILNRDSFVIIPTHGNIEISFANKSMLAFLFSFQTSQMDSGKFENAQSPAIDDPEKKLPPSLAPPAR